MAGNLNLTFPHEEPRVKNVCGVYGILVEKSFGLSKDDPMAKLKTEGFGTGLFSWPMQMQPMDAPSDPRFADIAGDHPVSKDHWNRGLDLPASLGQTKAQMAEVVEKLLECRA